MTVGAQPPTSFLMWCFGLVYRLGQFDHHVIINPPSHRSVPPLFADSSGPEVHFKTQ